MDQNEGRADNPAMTRVYGVRYRIESWNKPPQGSSLPLEKVEGVPISRSGDDYGYADDVLLCSVIRGKDGKIDSIGLFDSVSMCGMPPRDMLEEVKKAIDHYLLEHC